MRRPVLAIFDQKALLFGQVICPPATGIAVREFADLVNDPETVYAKHPEDYTLFQLGWYEDADGKLEPMTAPVSLGVGVTFVRPVDRAQLELLKPGREA